LPRLPPDTVSQRYVISGESAALAITTIVAVNYDHRRGRLGGRARLIIHMAGNVSSAHRAGAIHGAKL
jgi:hypothetical protein